MDVKEFKEPVPHIMIKNFLTGKELELIWKEVDELDFQTGKYQVDGVEKVVESKKNMGCTLNDVYPNIDDSYIRSLFWYRFQTNPDFAKEISSMSNPFWALFAFTQKELTKVSRYADGDKYDWHPDIAKDGLITIIYQFSKFPEHFTGGDFEIKNKIGEKKTIPFLHNSVIMFPRMYLHRVTPIVSKGKNWYDARFSIQWFVNIR